MEYTEKVKKAIKAIKYKLDNDDNSWFYQNEIETIIDLLEKQQKEINKLNSENKRIKYFSNNLFIDDYIPKEAIKEKMKQLEITDCTIRYDKYDIQDILKELLGE